MSVLRATANVFASTIGHVSYGAGRIVLNFDYY